MQGMAPTARDGLVKLTIMIISIKVQEFFPR